jgi:hypothetical protein
VSTQTDAIHVHFEDAQTEAATIRAAISLAGHEGLRRLDRNLPIARHNGIERYVNRQPVLV